MTGRTTSPLQVAFLGIAAALGVSTLGTSDWALANLQWALIGLPVAAASAAVLVYDGRIVVAALSLAAGVAGAAAMNPWSAFLAVPAALAVLGTIVGLRRVSYVWIGAGLIALFAVAGYGLDTVLATLRDRTLGEQLIAQVKAAAAPLQAASDPQTGTQLGKQLVQAYEQLVPLLPSVYFLCATLIAVAVIAAVAWAARRADEPVLVPPFDRVDLPPVVVLGAVVGLLAAGFARFGSAGGVWEAIGTNFIACTGFLLLIQGLAVYSALLKRAHVGTPGRVVVYVVLLVLDALLKIVTLTGLADLWLNFRKLPREGRPDLPPKPAPKPGDESSGA